jgi:hypothetical protein
MKQFKARDAESPTPEQLAAYVDGELDPGERMGVEKWLRTHPDVAAQIEEHRDLTRLWQAMKPIGPEEAKWAAVLEQIECGFLRSRPLGHGRRRIIRAGAALAAAVLLLLVWRYWPEPTAHPQSVEPLAVVSPDDVEIVSLRAADRVTLVVGVPPVTEPLVLASPNDVQFEHVEPDGDGMIPDIHMDEKSDTAMIVAPPSTATRGVER